MNMSKEIKIRLKLLLVIGILCIGIAMYNLWVANDFFAIVNFIVGSVAIFSYYKIKTMFGNSLDKTWRSYR